MSATVPPNLPPHLTAALSTALATARGSVVNLPNTVALTQGQAIPAQVISSGGGQLLLSSTLGNFTVQSNASLPAGTSVLLQVQSLEPTPQVTLQYHQGTGAQPGPLPHSGTPTPNAATAVPQAGTPVVTELTEGSVLQATVTRALPQTPAQTGAAPGSGHPGTAPPAATTAGAAATAATTTAATSAAATTSQPVLAAGSNLSVRILAVAPPGSQLPALPPTAAQPGALVFAAGVTGQQSGGAPIVAGPNAELALQNAHPLPAGSRLLLEVTNLRPPAAADARPALSFLGGRWDGLNDALTTLQQIDPALLRTAIESAIPSPGPRMTGTLLFFLSALFSGDVRRFVGAEPMRQLNRSAGGVADRLSSEFGQLQRTAKDATGQDWRLFLIPFLTEEGLDEMRFMLRKSEEDGKGGDAEAGTRFMIEVNLSRLGPIQFDGLTRRKHLDLVVRTQQPMPDAMHEDIRAIFGNTISALGFSGTITLRTVEKFDISPVEQFSEDHKDLRV